MNYDSPNEIMRVLDECGMSLKRRFGQNFMINRNAREKIVNCLDIVPGSTVWEIGPGLGALTGSILDRGAELTVFEIDRGFVRFLEERFSSYSGFRIVEGDVVKTWLEVWKRTATPSHIIGNLPYNAASAIIASFIEEGLYPDKMVFTVQKEVAERMSAERGSKQYSSFSLLTRFAYSVTVEGDLNPGSFYPAPDVVSSIVSFLPNRRYAAYPHRKLFCTLVHGLFLSRRKTVLNNLVVYARSSGATREQLSRLIESAGLRPDCRAEEFSLDQLVGLADAVAASLPYFETGP